MHQQASFRVTARVTVHIALRNGILSVGAEVGVDKFCLVALESELMLYCYSSKVCDCESPCTCVCWGWREGNWDSK